MFSLNERLSSTNITVSSVHPGVVKTGIQPLRSAELLLALCIRLCRILLLL